MTTPTIPLRTDTMRMIGTSVVGVVVVVVGSAWFVDGGPTYAISV